MTLSFDEALGLLSKWKTESMPVVGVVAFDGGGGTFWGFITDLDSNGFVVAQQASRESKALEMFFALGQASEFDYQDIREAPEEVRSRLASIVAVLQMRIGTSALTLFEKEQLTQR